jgi:hypothetical protein
MLYMASACFCHGGILVSITGRVIGRLRCAALAAE